MRFVATLLLTLLLTTTFAAEQLTTVAVVDLNRVFTTFYRESQKMRQLEDTGRQYKEDIANLNNRLESLKLQRFNAEERNESVRSLDAEIARLSEHISVLTQHRKEQIDSLRLSLINDEFFQLLQESIRIVSEENGFTVVLRSDTEGLQWWSFSVDISTQVMQQLSELFNVQN